MKRRNLLTLFGLSLGALLFMKPSDSNSGSGPSKPKHLEGIDPDKVDWKAKDDAYWKSVLSSEQFSVCRKAGTERPWSGQYCSTHEPGSYFCICCGQALFKSDDKFESGTGWPSFTEPVKPDAVEEHSDTSYGMIRTEVNCARCHAHLGHVFEDGPPPSGKRYCINSVCLFKA